MSAAAAAAVSSSSNIQIRNSHIPSGSKSNAPHKRLKLAEKEQNWRRFSAQFPIIPER